MPLTDLTKYLELRDVLINLQQACKIEHIEFAERRKQIEFTERSRGRSPRKFFEASPDADEYIKRIHKLNPLIINSYEAAKKVYLNALQVYTKADEKDKEANENLQRANMEYERAEKEYPKLVRDVEEYEKWLTNARNAKSELESAENLCKKLEEYKLTPTATINSQKKRVKEANDKYQEALEPAQDLPEIEREITRRKDVLVEAKLKKLQINSNKEMATRKFVESTEEAKRANGALLNAEYVLKKVEDPVHEILSGLEKIFFERAGRERNREAFIGILNSEPNAHGFYRKIGLILKQYGQEGPYSECFNQLKSTDSPENK